MAWFSYWFSDLPNRAFCLKSFCNWMLFLLMPNKWSRLLRLKSKSRLNCSRIHEAFKSVIFYGLSWNVRAFFDIVITLWTTPFPHMFNLWWKLKTGLILKRHWPIHFWSLLLFTIYNPLIYLKDSLFVFTELMFLKTFTREFVFFIHWNLL